MSLMGLHARASEKDKCMTVRAKCVEELLTTEVDYVKLLKNVIEVSVCQETSPRSFCFSNDFGSTQIVESKNSKREILSKNQRVQGTNLMVC